MVLNVDHLIIVAPAYLIGFGFLFFLRNRIKPLWGDAVGRHRVLPILGVIAVVLGAGSVIDLATLASGTFVSERAMLLLFGVAAMLPAAAVASLAGERLAARNPGLGRYGPWFAVAGLALVFFFCVAGLLLNGLGSRGEVTQRSKVTRVGLTTDIFAYTTLRLDELGTVLAPMSQWGTPLAEGEAVEVTWSTGLFGKRRLLGLNRVAP